MDVSLREQVKAFALSEYGTVAEKPWADKTDYEVLRHAAPGEKMSAGRNGKAEKKPKWYAVIMRVRSSLLGLPGDDPVDILNVKTDPETRGFLLQVEGFLPAYHMNKNSWITILLDGSVSLENIEQQLAVSFELTASAKEKKKIRTGPMDWIVPANPKYFDVVGAFEKNEIINWKQSSDVHVGDLIYMYVAMPYSALMYKCRALEVNIPWYHENKDLIVRKVMRIKLLCKYDPEFMPFSRMKDEFGVYAVRGPRSMPNSMKEKLNAWEQESL